MLSDGQEGYRLTWVLKRSDRRVKEIPKLSIYRPIGSESGTAMYYYVDGTVWSAEFDNIDDVWKDEKLLNSTQKSRS